MWLTAGQAQFFIFTEGEIRFTCPRCAHHKIQLKETHHDCAASIIYFFTCTHCGYPEARRQGLVRPNGVPAGVDAETPRNGKGMTVQPKKLGRPLAKFGELYTLLP